jgi:hypothetical protein
MARICGLIQPYSAALYFQRRWWASIVIFYFASLQVDLVPDPEPARGRASANGNPATIESWEKPGGVRWRLRSPSCWPSQALSSSPTGQVGGRGTFARKMSPSEPGCRSRLLPILTTSPPPYCFKPLGLIRSSRMIADPFATSRAT